MIEQAGKGPWQIQQPAEKGEGWIIKTIKVLDGGVANFCGQETAKKL